jgi:hypothetical protein
MVQFCGLQQMKNEAKTQYIIISHNAYFFLLNNGYEIWQIQEVTRT